VHVEQEQKSAQSVERVLFCLISSSIKSTVLELKIICFRDSKKAASKRKKHIKLSRQKRQGDAEKSSYSNRRETKSKLS